MQEGNKRPNDFIRVFLKFGRMIDIREILDSALLPELKCKYCKSLLSVPPVLLDKHGNSICGRCKGAISADLIYTRNTFYENLAALFRFPCSLISEGCRHKTNFKETRLHEEICPYQTIECQDGRCKWFGTFAELIIHYNEKHPELIMQNNCAKRLVGEEGCFMLNLDEFYFLLKWKYSSYNFKIKIKNLRILDLFDGLFYISLLHEDSKVSLKTSSANINTSVILSMEDFPKVSFPRLFLINASLSAETIENRKQNLQKIMCSFCNCQMVPPILRCHAGHTTCVDCTTAYYDTCEGCAMDKLRFTRNPELELIAQSFIYTCKWNSCGEKCSASKIQEHEHNCNKRVFECQHCCEWTGFVNEVIPHDMVCTYKDYPRHMIMDSKVSVVGTYIYEDEDLKYWLLAFNEYFTVDFKPGAEGIDVMISNYGLPSLFGWYYYEADLEHLEGGLDCPFYKIYQIKSKCGNVSTIFIPNTDIAHFGALKLYNLTVRIYLLHDSVKLSNVATNFKNFD